MSADGERLLARLDDYGLTPLCDFAVGMVTMTRDDPRLIEAAWRALCSSSASP